MAFTPMGDFTFNHADNIDKPNKAAGTNKTEFDSRGAELKTALNGLITELEAVTDGASGADNIGMTAITETGANTTVQSIIEALITRLKAVTDSASGADLIGATAITQTGAAATVQAILEALAPMTTQGDMVYQGASAPVRLAKGAAGQVLTMNSGATAPEWSTATDISGKIDKSVLAAKGDIIYASAASTPAALTAGTDGQVLTLASGAPTWADASGGGAETWTTVDSFTRASDSSYTVTDNATNQAIHAVGRPIRYADTAGTYNYGIITAYSSGTVTLSGAPMDTSHDAILEYGDFARVQMLPIIIPTTFASGGASTTLYNTWIKSNLYWQLGKAYLVRFGHIVDSDDTGANQTRANVYINGSAVGTSNTNAGPAISETITYETGYNTSNYDINFGEEIEISCDANGTNDDAKDLTALLTFVLA